MTEKFDELAKNLATQEELPRRRMLGQLAAAMGGGLVALFAGERSAAAAPPAKCPPGLTNCDGVCRDTAVNADHCGTCGNVCPAGEMCRSGVCVACTCAQACPSGQTSCGGTCVTLGQPCATGLTGECNAGATTCQNGAVVCSPIYSPRPETCNGKDDDCDGNIDNGFPVGQVCDCGGGRSGVFQCSPDGLSVVCHCSP